MIRAYQYVVRDKNGAHTHRAIQAWYTGLDGVERSLDEDVRWAIFPQVQRGATVPVVVWPRMGMELLGDRPTASVVAPILALLMAPGLFIVFLVMSRTTTPWYDRRRLVETQPGNLTT